MANNQKFKALIIGLDGSITTVAGLPAASEGYRDSLAVVYAAAGFGDRLLKCRKDAADNYNWEEVQFGGASGIGGVMNWAGTLIDGTPQVIIPNGGGDVTAIMAFDGVVSRSLGGVSNPGGNLTPGNSHNIYDAAGNQLRLRVNADGSVDIARVAGTGTYSAVLTLKWI